MRYRDIKLRVRYETHKYGVVEVMAKGRGKVLADSELGGWLTLKPREVLRPVPATTEEFAAEVLKRLRREVTNRREDNAFRESLTSPSEQYVGQMRYEDGVLTGLEQTLTVVEEVLRELGIDP